MEIEYLLEGSSSKKENGLNALWCVILNWSFFLYRNHLDTWQQSTFFTSKPLELHQRSGKSSQLKTLSHRQQRQEALAGTLWELFPINFVQLAAILCVWWQSDQAWCFFFLSVQVSLQAIDSDLTVSVQSFEWWYQRKVASRFNTIYSAEHNRATQITAFPLFVNDDGWRAID